MNVRIAYALKVPGDLDYSSKNFHVELTTDLSEGSSNDTLQTRIADLYEQAKSAVLKQIERVSNSKTKTEAEKSDTSSANSENQQTSNVQENKQSQGGNEKFSKATSKQINFLLKLAKHNTQLLEKEALKLFGTNSFYDISSKQASIMIDQLRGGNNGK